MKAYWAVIRLEKYKDKPRVPTGISFLFRVKKDADDYCEKMDCNTMTDKDVDYIVHMTRVVKGDSE